MKLKKLVKENTEEAAQKLTREQKKDVLSAVSKFNEYGRGVYRESDIRKMVSTIKELSTNASNLAISEAGDWFDSISVKRDVKEINSSVDIFEKTANELGTLQQRLESVFEDIGSKLGKYYEIKEAVDHIDDKEAETDYDDLKDKDIDNDGDQDDSDEYLHHKLGTTAKKTEGISFKGIAIEAAPRMKDSSEYKTMIDLRNKIANSKKGGSGNRYGREFEKSKTKALRAIEEMLTYIKIGV